MSIGAATHLCVSIARNPADPDLGLYGEYTLEEPDTAAMCSGLFSFSLDIGTRQVVKDVRAWGESEMKGS